MAGYKPYVAVQEFFINLNNGEKEVRAKYGDLIEFDGYSLKIKGEEGNAKSFSKVVREGEWVKPIAPEKVGLLKQRLAKDGVAEEVAGNVGPNKARNNTAGKIVEDSDVGSTKVIRNDKTDKELQDLVEQYEHESYDAIKETKIEDNTPEKKVNIIDDDASIVMQVSKEASTDASTKNTAGVELDDLVDTAATVVSEEERVAKPTNYSGKKASDEGKKKLVVDSEAEGVVVKKTSTPAVSKNEVNERTQVQEDSLQVSKEQEVVSETSYEEAKPTDIGSSTKAGVESSKKVSSKKGKKSAKVTNADNLDQGAVIVGKASTTDDINTVDGISVKTTVGDNQESRSEAKFSSGGDGIENTEVTFSKSEASVTDLSGTEEYNTSIKDAASIDDGGIDISDLLD